MEKLQLRKSMLEVLEKIESGGFSHLLIDREMKDKQFSERDSALLTEVVYGTMQRKLTLDYYLQAFLTKQQKIKNWVRIILRMSVYQMIYLDKVPDHAIIHEAVEISKEKGHKGIASLVNGVLRNIQRRGVSDLSEIKDDVKRLCITTSYPDWLVKNWIDNYGFQTAKSICEATLKQIPTAVRIQSLRISREEALEVLQDEKISARLSDISNEGLIIEQGNVLRSSLFTKGYLTIQDQSSMLAGDMLAVKPGMTVLDTCSAPGGKVTHIAELMHDDGHIDAHDLHANKIRAIEKKAKQLHLTIIHARQADARKLQELYVNNSFDRILIDAPCSGLGVIRSKPDIKYRKQEDDILSLIKIQSDMIRQASALLKPGGLLLYSTCTIEKRENENIIEKFLSEHPDFKMDESFFDELPKPISNSEGVSRYGLQLFPFNGETEGFFLARLVKRK